VLQEIGYQGNIAIEMRMQGKVESSLIQAIKAVQKIYF
jgi:hypothetical protein